MQELCASRWTSLVRGALSSLHSWRIDYTPWGKLWIFIGFQYFIFSMMGLFAYMVDDIPEEVYLPVPTRSPTPGAHSKESSGISSRESGTGSLSQSSPYPDLDYDEYSRRRRRISHQLHLGENPGFPASFLFSSPSQINEADDEFPMSAMRSPNRY